MFNAGFVNESTHQLPAFHPADFKMSYHRICGEKKVSLTSAVLTKSSKSCIFIHIIMCSVTRSVETWSENVLHCHQKASWRLSRKIWNCQRLTSRSKSNIPTGSRPHFHPYINTGAFPVFFNKVQSLISSFISFPFLWLSDFPLLLFVVSPILPHEKEYRWCLQWTGSVNRESGR